MKVKLENHIKKTIKDLEKAELEKRKKASSYLRRKLRLIAKKLFGSDSDITKGVKKVDEDESSFVGLGKPAYHAHLIEFGTDSRFKSSGEWTGNVKPSPFVFPTFEREKYNVIKILTESWL